MSNKKILILPGDGIGNEVMSEVLKIIDWMSKTKSIIKTRCHHSQLQCLNQTAH